MLVEVCYFQQPLTDTHTPGAKNGSERENVVGYRLNFYIANLFGRALLNAHSTQSKVKGSTALNLTWQLLIADVPTHFLRVKGDV